MKKGNLVLLVIVCLALLIIPIHKLIANPGFVAKGTSDRIIGVKLKKMLAHPEKFYILPYLPYEKVINIFAILDANIAMRYHGKVFSILTKNKLIPINYDDKCDELCKQQGIKGFHYADIKNNLDEILNELPK